MNWRTGAFRVWIVASVAWIAFTVWETSDGRFDDLIIKYGRSDQTVLGLRWDRAVNAFKQPEQYVWTFGPPAAVLALGLTLFWIGSGFRR